MLRDNLTTFMQSYNKFLREINEAINKMRYIPCLWFGRLNVKISVISNRFIDSTKSQSK